MLSPSSEDYLQSIFILNKEKSVVRVKDISAALGVSMPSVNQALSLLKEQKFIQHESYGYVELTKKGKEAGEKIYNRHEVLFKFLNEILGVSKKVAEEETCRVEHYISKNTLEKLTAFIETIESCPHKDSRSSKCGK